MHQNGIRIRHFHPICREKKSKSSIRHTTNTTQKKIQYLFIYFIFHARRNDDFSCGHCILSGFIEKNEYGIPPIFEEKKNHQQNVCTVCWFVQYNFYLLFFFPPTKYCSFDTWCNVESEFFFLLQWNSIVRCVALYPKHLMFSKYKHNLTALYLSFSVRNCVWKARYQHKLRTSIEFHN